MNYENSDYDKDRRIISLLETIESQNIIISNIKDKNNELEKKNLQYKRKLQQLEIKYNESKDILKLFKSNSLDLSDLNNTSPNPSIKNHSHLINEIKELRKQKTTLIKNIIALQDENKQQKQDIINEIAKRNGLYKISNLLNPNNDDVNSNSNDSILIEKLKNLNDKYQLLQGNMILINESKELLDKKNKELTIQLNKTVMSLSKCEDELLDTKENMKLLMNQYNNKSYYNLVNTNKILNEELITFKGKFHQLESLINDINVISLTNQNSVNDINILKSINYLIDSYKKNSIINPSNTLLTYISDDITAANNNNNNIYSNYSNNTSNSNYLHHTISSKLKENETKDKKQINQSPYKKNLPLDSYIDESTTIQSIYEMLTPIVEDRLFHSIFSRYIVENNNYTSSIKGFGNSISISNNQSNLTMSLTRFVRFAREFELVLLPNQSNNKQVTDSTIGIVSGSVDVIFMNASKISDNEKSKSIRPFCVRANNSYTGLLQNYPSYSSMVLAAANYGNTSEKFATISSSTSLSSRQFVYAIQQLACQIFHKEIENQTGATIDVLPDKQKSASIRLAVELLLHKKIIPIAIKQDLIPWSLMYFDCNLTTISKQNQFYNFMNNNCNFFASWYNNYTQSSNNNYSDSNENEIKSYFYDPMIESDNSSERLINSIDISLDLSYDINSPDKYNDIAVVNIDESKVRSPDLSNNISLDKLKLLKKDNSNNGISYRMISKFAHDYGIIPYLLNEPQVYSMFREIIYWSITAPEVIFEVLPESIRLISQSLSPNTYLSINNSKTNIDRRNLSAISANNSNIVSLRRDKTEPRQYSPNKLHYIVEKVLKSNQYKSIEKYKNSQINVDFDEYLLTFSGFTLLLSAIATQAFNEFPKENRFVKLYDWICKSRGVHTSSNNNH